jgi:hypothetical protein
MKKYTSARKYYSEIGPNFMTPNALSYMFVGRWAVELSEGKGMSGQPIYGVTAICAYTGEQARHISKMFNSIAEAEEHIAYLKE